MYCITASNSDSSTILMTARKVNRNIISFKKQVLCYIGCCYRN